MYVFVNGKGAYSSRVHESSAVARCVLPPPARTKRFRISLLVRSLAEAVLLGARAGIFFISLKIDYVDEDGEAAQDAHALVYDAARGHLLDNLRGKGAILIDDGDRVDNRTAMRPFYEELFPKATNITLRSVHEAQLAA